MRMSNWIRLSTTLLVLSLPVPGVLADIAVAETASDRLPPPSYLRGDVRRGADGALEIIPGSGASIRNPVLNDSLRARLDHTSGRTLVVGASGEYKSIQDAARAAGDGDVIEILPGEYHAQPVIWTQKVLTIRGMTPRPVILADDTSAEGKALWVIRNGDIMIDNVEFRGARVPDGNGAGIRFERGHLTISRCAFFDNENGILTSNVTDARLDVEDSEFGNAPHHAGRLHHLLYVGTIDRFTLRGSRFSNGYRGHLVKSRARESRIEYNLLDDGPTGSASYELEFPNGGTAVVIGNLIGQSRQSDNPVMVAYGAEGPRWRDNILIAAHNTLIDDRADGQFLRIWEEKFPLGIEQKLINNLLLGPTFRMLPSGLNGHGNRFLERGRGTDTGLAPWQAPASGLRGQGIEPGIFRGEALGLQAQFVFPLGARKVPPPATSTPGALIP